MGRYAVFDIDGVLADVRHRLSFIQQRPKQWDEFFRQAQHDPLLPEGATMLADAWDSGLAVVYSTGRPERCRRDTQRWLERYELPSAPLHMRGNSDRRPGRVTKLAVARRLREAAEVAYLVDDDPVVVQALREDGFDVVHATWMGTVDAPEAHVGEAQQLLFDLQEGGEF